MQRVSNDFGKNLSVSASAAIEYESQGEKMLERVNELMAEREDISVLSLFLCKPLFCNGFKNQLMYLANLSYFITS